MSDPLESLNIKAQAIKLACEKACIALGIPIDYKQDVLPEHHDSIHSPYGSASMLWREVEMLSRSIIRHSWGGGCDPSPFKTVAAVSLAIVACAPIPEFFPDTILANNLPAIASFPFAPAAIIAIDYSLSLLHTSKVGDDLRELSAPLEISTHYHLDLIAALTFFGQAMKCKQRREILAPTNEFLTRTKIPFSMLSLIYEALAYKANRNAENNGKIAFNRPEY